MAVSYFKRWKLEIDLRRGLPEPVLEEGFGWVPWTPSLTLAHAWVKFHAFREEMDSRVFRSLSTLEGCQQLMTEIAAHPAFLPQATWLIRFVGNDIRRRIACATIQGLRNGMSSGAIQNVGVHPEYRGLGLGRALLLKSLHGFRTAGCKRVSLDVTARNAPAVGLYRSLGFRLVRTTYREAPEEEPASRAATSYD